MQNTKKNFLKCFHFFDLVDKAEVCTKDRFRAYSGFDLSFTNAAFYYQGFPELKKTLENDFKSTKNPALEGEIAKLKLIDSKKLEIKRLDHFDKIDEFYNIFNSVFDIDTSFNGFKHWHRKYGVTPDKEFQYFTGYLDGKAVAIGAVLMDGDFAGFYNIGVLKDYRKQGLGAEITSHVIKYAQSKGAKFTGCYSSPDGMNVYQGLGLELLYEDKCYFKV